MTSIVIMDSTLESLTPSLNTTFIFEALMQILTFIILKVFNELFLIFMFHFASESINKYKIL
jgi:hypothetical protein